MWELAKSLLKFGAAENNDTAFHDDSSHLSSQSDKEHHNNMRGSRKLRAKSATSANKRRRENPGSRGRLRSRRMEEPGGRTGKRTGLDDFSSDEDSEEEQVDHRVAKRHDFDDEQDDDDSDDELVGGSERSSGGSKTMSVSNANNQRGGRVSTSPGGNDNMISSVSERSVELERELKAARDEIVSLKGELEGTRRRHEILTTLKDSPDVAISDPLYKKLDQELRGIIRRVVLRLEKLWSDDMALYSEDEDTYCQIILKAVKWPGSVSEEEKVRIWKEFLSPRFKRAFCLERNRINQRMKKYFNSKFIDLWVLCLLYSACYTILTFNTHRRLWKLHLLHQQ